MKRFSVIALHNVDLELDIPFKTLHTVEWCCITHNMFVRNGNEIKAPSIVKSGLATWNHKLEYKPQNYK